VTEALAELELPVLDSEVCISRNTELVTEVRQTRCLFCKSVKNDSRRRDSNIYLRGDTAVIPVSDVQHTDNIELDKVLIEAPGPGFSMILDGDT